MSQTPNCRRFNILSPRVALRLRFPFSSTRKAAIDRRYLPLESLLAKGVSRLPMTRNHLDRTTAYGAAFYI